MKCSSSTGIPCDCEGYFMSSCHHDTTYLRVNPASDGPHLDNREKSGHLRVAFVNKDSLKIYLQFISNNEPKYS